MPFQRYGHKLINLQDAYFARIDLCISQDVLPRLKWQEEHGWRMVVIVHNLKWVRENQSRSSSLVTACKHTGLLLCDIGCWLDNCLIKQAVVHADSVSRQWNVESESLTRFDLRKY